MTTTWELIPTTLRWVYATGATSIHIIQDNEEPPVALCGFVGEIYEVIPNPLPTLDMMEFGGQPVCEKCWGAANV